MLIGQDPTVRVKPDRVKHVLMLDDPNSQLSRWLRGLLGKKIYESAQIYATNLVKCTFEKPPADFHPGGLAFIRPYFEQCQAYLRQELASFQPELVLTLGEPAHNLFCTLLDNGHTIPPSMKAAFTGQFYRAAFNGFEFDYSPCLHLQTFRVAETYGEKVATFKTKLTHKLSP